MPSAEFWLNTAMVMPWRRARTVAGTSSSPSWASTSLGGDTTSAHLADSISLTISVSTS